MALPVSYCFLLHIGSSVRLTLAFAGFVRFTSTYYLILIKSRTPVGLIGGHYIYHCESTHLRPIAPPTLGVTNTEEAKRLAVFQSVDLNKNFYFRRAGFVLGEAKPLLTRIRLDSYTYDLTHTLQHNFTRGSATPGPPAPNGAALPTWKDKFVWNHHLLVPMFQNLKSNSPWILPLIYGFVDQAKLAVFGRSAYITLIARRSRHFAGARFLRRGGFVANEVETEQIVSEALTTPFHAPAPSSHTHTHIPSTRAPSFSNQGAIPYPVQHQNRRPNPRYTSHVQARGSIPLFWVQDTSNSAIKPPIEMTIRDPYYAAAARHFDDLFEAYGVADSTRTSASSTRRSASRVFFLSSKSASNTSTSSSRTRTRSFTSLTTSLKPRRSEFPSFPSRSAMSLMFSRTLPKMQWSRRTSSIPAQNRRAESFLPKTSRRSFLPCKGLDRHLHCLRAEQLHNAPDRSCKSESSGRTASHTIAERSHALFGSRTNAAQFVIGKVALGHQLRALGIVNDPKLGWDSDAINLLTEIYHDHGDTIAIQYGGSHLVNTVESYRTKVPQWSSHSRDMVENIKRYYANSFVDAEKQAGIDLFLGIEPSLPRQPVFEALPASPRRSYQDWFTPAHIAPRLSPDEVKETLQKTVDEDDNGSWSYWQGYYRPKLYTRMARHFGFTVNSTLTAVRTNSSDEHSPFIPRTAVQNPRLGAGGLRRWLSYRGPPTAAATHARQSRVPTGPPPEDLPSYTAALAPTTTAGLAEQHLRPHVKPEELREYEAWLGQFEHLSLSQDLSEKDRSLYTVNAELAKSGGAPVAGGPVLSEKDRAVYAGHVAAARAYKEAIE
ncbi:SPOSA6832_00369, partial [Sporobolomyces salmonicolor]